MASPIGSEVLASNPSGSALDIHIVVTKESSIEQERNEHYSWIQEVQAQEGPRESQEKELLPFPLKTHQEDRVGSKFVSQSGDLGCAGNINEDVDEEVSKYSHVIS